MGINCSLMFRMTKNKFKYWFLLLCNLGCAGISCNRLYVADHILVLVETKTGTSAQVTLIKLQFLSNQVFKTNIGKIKDRYLK